MHLAENLRILRTQRGLTQAEMAKVFHLKPSSIEMYESGERIPKLPMLIQMAEYFSVTLDQLVLKELKPDAPRYVRNLRYLRSKRNMMQEDTGAIIGCSGEAYDEVEHGKARLSIEQLLKLSEFFGVTLDQLVKTDLTGGEGEDE